ncbi:hypothetical protein EVAR_47036_1 [Eumeta japonica]|uniref:Uncharacterized protein n=1 Tax=Eumeta variegata TaxID=151549 RepID=A0A4C1XJW5_EUMVA|nr:hypothetical protein EVAR_47036_1 [Eumeta japonica]
MVRTLLDITKEGDPSPAEHRPIDDRGRGMEYCTNSREVAERSTPPKRNPQDASSNPRIKPGRPSRREMGPQMDLLWASKGPLPTWTRWGRIPDKKTPVHEARVSPLSRICGQNRSRKFHERNVRAHTATSCEGRRTCDVNSLDIAGINGDSLTPVRTAERRVRRSLSTGPVVIVMINHCDYRIRH